MLAARKLATAQYGESLGCSAPITWPVIGVRDHLYPCSSRHRGALHCLLEGIDGKCVLGTEKDYGAHDSMFVDERQCCSEVLIDRHKAILDQFVAPSDVHRNERCMWQATCQCTTSARPKRIILSAQPLTKEVAWTNNVLHTLPIRTASLKVRMLARRDQSTGPRRCRIWAWLIS